MRNFHWAQNLNKEKQQKNNYSALALWITPSPWRRFWQTVSYLLLWEGRLSSPISWCTLTSHQLLQIRQVESPSLLLRPLCRMALITVSLRCTQFSLEHRNTKPNFLLCEAPCPKTRPDLETAVELSWNDSLAVSHSYKFSIGSQNSVNISIAFFKLLITGPFRSCQTCGAFSEKWFVTQIMRPSWPAPGKESVITLKVGIWAWTYPI